jgi:hypothetical protein
MAKPRARLPHERTRKPADAHAQVANWLLRGTCLALMAFALGVLEGSLQPWPSEPVPALAFSAPGMPGRETTRQVPAAEAATTPHLDEGRRALPRFTARTTQGNLGQPQPVAWSGDMRAFLRHVLLVMHRPSALNTPLARRTLDPGLTADPTSESQDRAASCPGTSMLVQCQQSIVIERPLPCVSPARSQGAHHAVRSIELADAARVNCMRPPSE